MLWFTHPGMIEPTLMDGCGLPTQQETSLYRPVGSRTEKRERCLCLVFISRKGKVSLKSRTATSTRATMHGRCSRCSHFTREWAEINTWQLQGELVASLKRFVTMRDCIKDSGAESGVLRPSRPPIALLPAQNTTWSSLGLSRECSESLARL